MIAYLLPLPFQASTSLDALLDSNPCLAGASYGVTVSRLNGEILFSRNADKRLIPASNQKLLSTIYAVHTLGLDFRPKTTTPFRCTPRTTANRNSTLRTTILVVRVPLYVSHDSE